MKAWRRKWVWFSVAALAVTGIGLRVTSRGVLSMSFVEFPVGDLKTVEIADPAAAQPRDAGMNAGGPAPAILQIAGDGGCTLRSSMTAIAGRFLPGTTFVDVTVNGQKSTLVVDTGCRTTALFPRLARRAGVPIAAAPIGTWEKSDGQGTTPVHRGLVSELAMGSFTVSNLPVMVLGRQHEVRLLGIPVYHMDGLLGIDILRNFAVTFVLTDGAVRMARTAAPTGPHARRIPFRLSKQNDCMIVQVTVNGQPIGECIVDTGSSSAFMLPEDAWNTLGLGAAMAHVDVRLGDVAMEKVPATRGGIAGMGMVPMNVLATPETRTITIDFPAEQIIYE